MTHIIRLRGAWETSTSGEITHHTRKFGRPRTLDAHEQVWLVCQHVPGPARMLLNGQQIAVLATNGLFSVEITKSVETRNALQFEVSSSQPLGEVTIEIRSPS